eukprot:6490618-Amphidinium_carterae.1
MSQRFNVAILRSAIGTPSDPSSKLQEFEEEFIALQRDDVIPTPLDIIQPEESSAAQPAAAAAAASYSAAASSTDQPMEVGQPAVQSSSTTFTPSGPTGMPIPSDSPVVRPPPGLEDQRVSLWQRRSSGRSPRHRHSSCISQCACHKGHSWQASTGVLQQVRGSV